MKDKTSVTEFICPREAIIYGMVKMEHVIEQMFVGYTVSY